MVANVWSQLTTYINSYLLGFPSNEIANILPSLISKWDNEEAIHGESNKQYSINDVYYAGWFAYILYQYVVIYGKDWELVKTQFNYEEVKKCFFCKGINLDDFLQVVGLPLAVPPTGLSFGIGIENIGIENSYEIEPTYAGGASVAPTPINISELLATGNVCNFEIDTTC